MRSLFAFLLLCGASIGGQAMYIDDTLPMADSIEEPYRLFEVPHEGDYDEGEEQDLVPSEEDDNQYSKEDVDLDLGLSSEENKDEAFDQYPLPQGLLSRSKRQVMNDAKAVNEAMDLALSHRDYMGRDRPVGKLHSRIHLNAFGKNGQNYHAHGGIGAGTVLWRSKNKKHSLGIGAYADQHRGRFQGFRYKFKPNFGAGIGYRFRF